MKILLVDDEPLARQRLQRILDDYCKHVISAANGLEAIEMCNLHHPDVVLLDIRMPGMDGLEAAQHISQMDQSPAIIFITAYDEYALKAFEVHAVDYLLKPVREEKLKAALANACQLNRAQLASLKAEAAEASNCRTNIAAKISGNIKLIPVDDILFFQAEQKYVTVKYRHGETIIEDTLKELQQEFSEDFLRVHRNALVAKKFINGVKRNSSGHSFITLEGDNKLLEISRRHLSAVKKLISHI